MVDDRLKIVISVVIAFLSVVSNLNVVMCSPSAQQEHELLLLDALSRKQISTNLNAISNNNNYESSAIMNMLGRRKPMDLCSGGMIWSCCVDLLTTGSHDDEVSQPGSINNAKTKWKML
ncbi:CLUMA_CG011322, isoform A [Clunio marinus]|uniref:CLUMA_CG011322, isoform A n=1 Tax=Clunio marinus TaxID=568069 RepID=A0A1J1ICD6_9DIPT|nr:CLUMA_CG011322, isoform A [Clunio marinus]